MHVDDSAEGVLVEVGQHRRPDDAGVVDDDVKRVT